MANKVNVGTSEILFSSQKISSKKGLNPEKNGFFREIVCLDFEFIKPKYPEQSNSIKEEPRCRELDGRSRIGCLPKSKMPKGI